MTEHKCSVCQCDFTDDEGGVHGEFGIIPVSFCPTCFSCMCDMVEQLDDREWEGLTEEEIDKAWRSVDYTVPWDQHRIDIARAIEIKLKEKNYEST
jgi:hypothetical protein